MEIDVAKVDTTKAHYQALVEQLQQLAGPSHEDVRCTPERGYLGLCAGCRITLNRCIASIEVAWGPAGLYATLVGLETLGQGVLVANPHAAPPCPHCGEHHPLAPERTGP